VAEHCSKDQVIFCFWSAIDNLEAHISSFTLKLEKFWWIKMGLCCEAI
jgi:hypothetical protein